MALSLLSPLLAELLSGSSPPSEFFRPAAFLLLWAFYGGGVLLIREIWVGLGGGIGRLLLLGMFYGVVEEGLVLKSWFDPLYFDLHLFATYGRFWGTNVAWAIWLTLFHALMSITAPILLCEIAFPAYRDRSLMGRRARLAVALLFIASALLMAFGLNPYLPPFQPYAAAVALAGGLVLLARRYRELLLPPLPRWLCRHPILLGFGTAALLFFNAALVPPHRLPLWLFALCALLPTLLLTLALRDASEAGRYRLLLGFLAFHALPMAWIWESMGVRGMAVTGAVIFGLLVLGLRRLPL